MLTPYMKALKQLVPKLLAWAAEGKDPELRAHVVMEDVLPWVQDLVAAEALKPDFQAQIFTAFPELQQQGQWIHDFLTAITEWATPEDEAPSAAPNNGVDMGD